MARTQVAAPDAEVCYDARAEPYEKTPPLAEWLQTHPKLHEALQTCVLRFVVNLTEEFLLSAPRLCFELQQAYWYYVDELLEKAKRELPKLTQVNFIHLILEASEVLRAIYSDTKARTQLLNKWREYCRKLPIKGAVLFNQDLTKCVMVQPWKGDKWGFPRGKINEEEGEIDCAIREVWEETGIDIRGMVDPTHFVKSNERATGTTAGVTLFMVQGIPEGVEFSPKTRKEISKIAWIDVRKLPNWEGRGDSPMKFFGVEPFVPDIKKWVQAQRRLQKAAGRQPSGAEADLAAWGASAAGPGRDEELGMDFDEAVNFRGHNGPVQSPPPVQVAGGDLEEVEARLALRARQAQSGGAGGARASLAGRSVPLDMARVMREFDRGWNSRAPRG